VKDLLKSALLSLACAAVITPAWADDDDFNCHRVATQPSLDPASNPMGEMVLDSERVEFFSKCKVKSDVAAYCKHLTTTIRHKDPGSNAVIKYFIHDKGPCKDKDSVQAYCKLWTTYDGLKILIEEDDGYGDPFDPAMEVPTHVLARSAKLCGLAEDAFLAKFCSAAATSKNQRDLDLAVLACATEGKEIYMRGCVGKLYRGAPVTQKTCEENYNRMPKKF
jgi:hypothetical protein